MRFLIAALEAHYGVTLLRQTTRAISLTEEGRTLLASARQVLAISQELDNRIRLSVNTLSGLIRVNALIDLGRTQIKPVLDKFLAAHPQVTIELLLSDDYVNTVDEGMDIAVRFGRHLDNLWPFRVAGQVEHITVTGDRIANDGGVVRDCI